MKNRKRKKSILFYVCTFFDSDSLYSRSLQHERKTDIFDLLPKKNLLLLKTTLSVIEIFLPVLNYHGVIIHVMRCFYTLNVGENSGICFNISTFFCELSNISLRNETKSRYLFYLRIAEKTFISLNFFLFPSIRQTRVCKPEGKVAERIYIHLANMRSGWQARMCMYTTGAQVRATAGGQKPEIFVYFPAFNKTKIQYTSVEHKGKIQIRFCGRHYSDICMYVQGCLFFFLTYLVLPLFCIRFFESSRRQIISIQSCLNNYVM